MQAIRIHTAALAISLGLAALPAQACGPSDPLLVSLAVSLMPSVALSQGISASMQSLTGGDNKVTVKHAAKRGTAMVYALQNEATGVAAEIELPDQRSLVAVGTVLTIEADLAGHALKQADGQVVAFVPNGAGVSLLGTSKAAARSS